MAASGGYGRSDARDNWALAHREVEPVADRRPQRPSRPSVRQARLPRARNAASRPHRLSRAEREAKRQRQLYIGIGAVVAIIAAVLVGTYIWTDVVRPRQVLASVNGTDISREDYWHARGVTLVDQVDQYSYLAGVVGGDQASQYQNAAANAQTELSGLWGSTSVNDQYLQQMIDDQLYVQYANTVGVTITDQDVDAFILNRFAPQDAPILAPTVEPTLIPERASWATQTAVVTGGAPSPAAVPTEGTPVINVAAGTPATLIAGTPGTDGALSVPTAVSPGATDATPVGPVDSVAPSGVPESAVGSPAVSPTPDAEQARSTAEAGYGTYQDRAFKAAKIDERDYRRWVAMPALARQRVTTALDEQLGQAAPQVHGYHILVATQELANQISAQLNAGADFGEIARSQSVDTATAPNGGDLGWYSQYDVDGAFWSATSGLAAGQTSAPFQTPSGWEIVRVTETSPNRAFTDDQLSNARSAVADQWLAARSGEASVSGEADPTPTPATAEFTPPVNAPTGVALPEGTPLTGTPVSSPAGAEPTMATPGVGTPVA